MDLGRRVTTPVAIALGFLGFLVGVFGFIGLVRGLEDMPVWVAYLVLAGLAGGAWAVRRRDVAVGLVLGTVAITLVIVAALRSIGS